MSKDVKPLTPTKRTKPYTIQELAALKDAQGPRAESLLDFLGVQATVEALDEARADNAAMVEALSHFPECNHRYVDEPEGTTCLDLQRRAADPKERLTDEFRAQRISGAALCDACKWAAAVLAQPHPGSALLERLKKAEGERDEAQRLWRQHQKDLKEMQRIGADNGAQATAAEARVKELESELKEAHRQRLEACEGESERAVERDEALKELEEVKARADAALARVKELKEALREVAGFFENSRRAESKGAHEYNAAFMRALVMGVVDAAPSTPKVKPSGLTLSQEEVAKVRAVAALLVRIMERRVGLSATRADLEAAQESLAILDKVKP